MALSHYMLGFLSCDGSFDANGCTVGLQIQRRDASVIDYFEQEVVRISKHQPSRDLRKIDGRSYVRLRVHDRLLWEEILQLLGGRLKAQRDWPDWATVEFLRGVWDADGSFQCRRNSIEGEISHPSRQWLQSLVGFIEESSGLSCRQLEARKGCFRLGVSAQICKWLRDHVYHSGFCLDRKREQLCSFHSAGPGRRWQQWQVDYLRENFISGGDSWRTIAEHIGKSPKAVSKKIWQLGLVER